MFFPLAANVAQRPLLLQVAAASPANVMNRSFVKLGGNMIARSLATRSPGNDPLTVIRKECEGRHLCDEHGYRRPGVHWVFSLAVTPDDVTMVRSATTALF